MKIREKIMMDKAGLERFGPINIVIFGDSVSHGAVNGYIDYEGVYWNRLKKKMNAFRDYIPVNMINSSIGGTTASASVSRLDSQVLKHGPDLVIVCFGLNDVNGALNSYTGALRTIFSACQAAGTELIFMTPNMLNTRLAPDTPKEHFEYAKKTAEMQNGGKMDEFMSAAVSLATEMGVTVCDCYAEWKALSKSEDVTLRLANRINHPTTEMHELFATKLYELILGEPSESKSSDSTMYKE